MSEMEPAGEMRVSVSLAQLRAELTGLELRLVDRLNLALVEKADKVELSVLHREVDHVVSRVSHMEQEMVSLHEIGKYKKWLWAQTLALAMIAVPVFSYVAGHLGSGQ